MIQWPESIPVYLYRVPVDFRKQINGLSLIVQESLNCDPYAAALYVFRNRGRDRIKCLYWHRNGFCLWIKRLEKDTFTWPSLDEDDAVITLTTLEYQALLDGFDIWHQSPHQRLSFTAVG